jgi:hypothetical protein
MVIPIEFVSLQFFFLRGHEGQLSKNPQPERVEAQVFVHAVPDACCKKELYYTPTAPKNNAGGHGPVYSAHACAPLPIYGHRGEMAC